MLQLTLDTGDTNIYPSNLFLLHLGLTHFLYQNQNPIQLFSAVFYRRSTWEEIELKSEYENSAAQHYLQTDSLTQGW